MLLCVISNPHFYHHPFILCIRPQTLCVPFFYPLPILSRLKLWELKSAYVCLIFRDSNQFCDSKLLSHFFIVTLYVTTVKQGVQRVWHTLSFALCDGNDSRIFTVTTVTLYIWIISEEWLRRNQPSFKQPEKIVLYILRTLRWYL